MQVELMKHQADFCSDFKTPYLALIGGFGSGKTYAFCLKTIIAAGLNAGFEGAVAEPTNFLTRTHLIPNMERALIAMGVPYDFEKSLQIFHMHFREGTTKVYCLSGENYTRLVGYNLAFFGSDETDTSAHDVAAEMWNKAISRVRWGPHRQIWSTSTPEGYKFLYDFFVTKSASDRRTIHASSYDNPFLDSTYLETMRANYTPAQWKVWALGQFGNLHTERVYSNFDRDLNGTTRSLKDFPGVQHLHIGMDFNVGNMAAVVHVIDEGRPFAVSEIVGLKDTAAMVAAIRARYPRQQITVYPDASGKNRNAAGVDTSHSILHSAGFRLAVHPSNPPVGDRINSVNAAFCNDLGHRRYLVNTRECPTLASNLERQGWVAGEPDKSNNIDHVLDAAGYFIHYQFPVRGRPTLRTH